MFPSETLCVGTITVGCSKVELRELPDVGYGNGEKEVSAGRTVLAPSRLCESIIIFGDFG